MLELLLLLMLEEQLLLVLVLLLLELLLLLLLLQKHQSLLGVLWVKTAKQLLESSWILLLEESGQGLVQHLLLRILNLLLNNLLLHHHVAIFNVSGDPSSWIHLLHELLLQLLKQKLVLLLQLHVLLRSHLVLLVLWLLLE